VPGQKRKNIMKKLNGTSSANLRVVADDQLEQVVGGRGHGHQGHGGHQSGGHLGNGHQSQGGGHLSNDRHSSGAQSSSVSVNVFFIQVFNTTNNIGTTSTTNLNA
jgi:hypothetical protein